jgi:hypothetical protein
MSYGHFQAYVTFAIDMKILRILSTCLLWISNIYNKGTAILTRLSIGHEIILILQNRCSNNYNNHILKVHKALRSCVCDLL